MKKLYASLTFLCIALTSFAQDKQVLELQTKFWNSGDEKQQTTNIPEKWKGESAVMLYFEENYKYTNSGKKMFYPSYFHQRIKLLDKAAVDYFSKYTFKKDYKYGRLFSTLHQENTIVGIKIIKPDGTENIVDIDEEKVVQDDMVKIAIPGLEIGDIIDIFIYQDDLSKDFSGTNIYEPEEKVLSAKYPILYRKLSIEVEKDYYLNMESFNGAPEIKEVPTEKRSTRRYVLEATDLEKNDFPRWFYPMAELPSVKFQVVFALNGRSAKAFIGEDDAVRKSSVSDEEIMEYYGASFDTYSRSSMKPILDFLEDKNITDKREQMVQALYYLRHHAFNRYIEVYLANQNKIVGYAEPCERLVILNENNFVNFIAGLAKQLEIDYDIIVATPRHNGSIDDMLIRENVVHGLRLNFPDPLYFFQITPNTQAEYFPSSLEGTKIYSLGVKKNRKVESVDTDVLPVSTYQENLDKSIIEVSFGENFEVLNVNRQLHHRGHFKKEALNSKLFLSDFLNEEFERFGTDHFYHCKKRLSNKGKAIKQKMDALMLSLREQHTENMEETVNQVYDVEIENYDYKAVDAARYSNEAFVLEDSFTIKNEFVQKAGPNYIVKVGKFIGGQVQLKKEDEERQENVYLDYAKTYSNIVKIKIPEGYKVVGLDNLNKNVSNETGSFVATAKEENGFLEYSTTKIYAKAYYPAEEWKKMLPWLKAAYEFSQEKVMFKKI